MKFLIITTIIFLVELMKKIYKKLIVINLYKVILKHTKMMKTDEYGYYNVDYYRSLAIRDNYTRKQTQNWLVVYQSLFLTEMNELFKQYANQMTDDERTAIKALYDAKIKALWAGYD
jgi:hypothetical protein